MSLKINLLKQKEKKTKEKKIRKTASSLGIVIMILVLLSLLSVYFYYFLLLKRTNSLAKSIENYKQEIAKYKDVEDKKSLINELLSKIKKIYQNRADFAKGITEIESILPEGITNQEMTLENTGNTKMKVIASSSAEIEKFVSNLNSLRERGLTQATLVSLSRGKEESYDIELKLEIPKKEEEQ